MNAGPFRDTLTPLIEEARRQLADLRQRRAALEDRHEQARIRLDAKTDFGPTPADPLVDRVAERGLAIPPPPATLKAAFFVGLFVGLLTWFQTFGHHR